MADILLLTHRIPFPPNKGDKVRSFHLMRHLAQQHRVHLGTFVDDAEDLPHVPALSQWCASVHAVPLPRWKGRLRSLRGLAQGRSLSVAHYQDPSMAAWVQALAATVPLQATVVFSSAMAPYAVGRPDVGHLLVDFVDLDSAKWTAYAQTHRGPLSWLYRREGERLADYERSVARQSDAAYFVSDAERELFLRAAPDCRPHVYTIGNGVDADYFSPEQRGVRPFPESVRAVVFTGAMDYWPNADAVQWFVHKVWPQVVQRHPDAHFYIVGRNPTEAVRMLQQERVTVTGTVADVRPYLGHAHAVVAPLRLARGIQNKVLEAMAMAAPVVAAKTCVDALQLHPDEGVVTAVTADDYVTQVDDLLTCVRSGRTWGQAARECVLRRFAWDSHLSLLDADLLPRTPQQAVPPPAKVPVAPGTTPAMTP